MEHIKFQYSTFRVWLLFLLNLVMIGFAAYATIFSRGDERMASISGLVIFALVLVYVGNNFLLPLANGKTILEIDSEMLHYALKDLTLYWKDIDDLDYEDFDFSGPDSNTFRIRFTMKDDSPVIRIATWFIAGDNKAIFNAILTTFLKYR
jgi:hypothetical protein